MLQIVYISSAVGPVDVADILAVSRRNNRRDGVTGLLFADGVRFLQALEGPPIAVEAAFARIGADRRHRAIVQLSRRDVAAREFGDWEMARQAVGEGGDAFTARVATLVGGASANVRGTFDGFARLRRAA